MLEKLNKAQRIAVICGVALAVAVFLVPGFGAQGGGAQQAVSGFCRGPNGLEGGIVNSARDILYPAANSWEFGFEDALQGAIDALGDAVR